MLSYFIHIRNRLSEISVSTSEIVGSIIPDSEEISQIKKLSELSCIENFVLFEGKNKPIAQINEGEKIQIKLYPNQLGEERYYEDFDDLLKFSSQEFPLKRFYINSLKYDSSGSEKPDIIRNYEAATKLISFLKSLSDYQKNRELVFFQSKQLVLVTDYSSQDLAELSSIDDLTKHIQDSADKEERKIIFTNELITSLLKVPEVSNRFKFILKNFNDLFLNYKKSHSLYLEKYSYQKFKSEIDKEIIEYSKKIQSVINDAQSKLVAIPAAFLLIIGQFDLTGEKIYFNLALILSALVFSILLEVLLRNQFSALDFISDDIKRFKNSVDDKKVTLLGDDFSATFLKIQKLYERQITYLNIVRWLVWLTPVFSVGLFILSLTNNTFVCILRTLFKRF